MPRTGAGPEGHPDTPAAGVPGTLAAAQDTPAAGRPSECMFPA